jgi:hypothetical protein
LVGIWLKLPAIMEVAYAPGLRARRLGREQRLRFQGLAARQSLIREALIRAAPMCHRSGLSNGWTTRKVVYPRYRRLPAVRG